MRDSRVIFSRGEELFTAGDVIDAALVRGDLADLWNDFLRALACVKRAGEQELELSDDAIDSAAVSFRYQHDLITAEETERWLEDRGVTMEEFGEHFARQYWADNCDGAPEPSAYSSATPEEKEQFLIHLTLTGELDRLAEELSHRIAARAESSETDDMRDEREKFIAREEVADLAAWLQSIERDPAWLDEVLAGEQTWGANVASLVDEKSLERELTSMRLNLTRFSLETIEVDSRDAAAEVQACVRSDGMELSDIAEESRYPFRRSEVLLEDLPAELQGNFLSVRAGALLEPIARDDGFEVCRVKARIEPELGDAAIRERLVNQISRRHFSELVSKHIDWKLIQATSE